MFESSRLIIQPQQSVQPTAPISNPPYFLVWDEGTTNLIPNPSFEVDTASWNPSGANAAISRITSDKYVGSACCQIVVSPAADAQGIISSSITTTVSKNYILSGWMKGNAGAEGISMIITGSNSGATSYGKVLTTSWSRFEIIKTLNASDTSVTVSFKTNGSQAVTFFLDGVQLEQKDISGTQATSYEATHATYYCDGSLGLGHGWNGTPHNASSTRIAGAHILAPITVGSLRGFAMKPDGTIPGPLVFTPDIQEVAPGLFGVGTRNNTNPRAPYYAKGYWPGQSLQFGNLSALWAFKNTANGAAIYCESAATTDAVATLNGPSITSGTILAVYAPSNLAAMQVAGGKLLDFADKSGASTLKCTVNSLTHGAANLNYRHYQLNMGAGKYAKTSTSKAGTVGTQITNRTGTIAVTGSAIAGIGTSFGTAGQMMVGDTILVSGQTFVIATITSTTVATTVAAASPNIVAGANYKNTNIVEGSGTAFTTDFTFGDIIIIGTAEQVVKAADSATLLRVITPFGSIAASTVYSKKDAQYEPWFQQQEGPNGDHETLDYVDRSVTTFINGEERLKLFRMPAVSATGTIQTNMTGGSECCVIGSGTSFTSEFDSGDIIIAGGQRKVVAGTPPSATMLFTRTPFSPALAAGTTITRVNVSTSTQNPDLSNRFDPTVSAPAADTDGVYFILEEFKENSQKVTTSNTAEQSIFTTAPTIRAGGMGTVGGLEIKGMGTLGAAAAGKTLTIKVKLGSTTILTTLAETIANTAANDWWLEVMIYNRTATTQVVGLIFKCKPQTDGGAVEDIIKTSTSSVDTTVDNVLDITIQYGGAVSNTFTKEFIYGKAL